MARTLYCRWADCRETWDSIAGQLPEFCPSCKRAQRWSTTPGRNAIIEWKLGDPVRPFALNVNDCRFLKSLRILAELDDRIDDI